MNPLPSPNTTRRIKELHQAANAKASSKPISPKEDQKGTQVIQSHHLSKAPKNLTSARKHDQAEQGIQADSEEFDPSPVVSGLVSPADFPADLRHVAVPIEEK